MGCRQSLTAVVVIAIALVSSVTVTVHAENLSTPNQTIKVAALLTISTLDMPIILDLMKTRGFDKEFGIDIEIVPLPSADIEQHLIEGKVDVAMMRGLTFLELVGEGLGIKAFMVTSRNLTYPGILALEDIGSIEDLKGKTTGITSFDERSLLPIAPIWTEFRVSPEEVRWVTVDSAEERMQALLNRRFEAALLPPYETFKALEIYPKLQLLQAPSLSKVFLDYWDYVLVAKEEVLEEKRSDITLFSAALLKTVQTIRDDKDEWTNLVLQTIPTANKDIVDKSWDKITLSLVPQGVLPEDSFVKFVDAYEPLLGIKPAYAEAVNSEIAKEAGTYIRYSVGEREILSRLNHISEQLAAIQTASTIMVGVLVAIAVALVAFVANSWKKR